MRVRAPAAHLLRFGLVAAGAGALLHAALVLVVLPKPTSLDHAAARIVMGDRYRPEELDRYAPVIAALELTPAVRATSLRSAVIVVLRQAETAIEDGRRADIDAHMDALGRLLPRALSGLPGDAFLWLALFWRDNLALGFDQARLPLLDMSYETGPNEGWLGVKRIVRSLALWEQLTPALKTAVAREFVGLVKARFFRAMPDIFTGPGWAARDALLPGLAQIDEPTRRAFARALNQRGVNVDVPGIEQPDARPWSR